MGIRLDIFTLHQFRNEDNDCEHLLLLKVSQRSFNNADEDAYVSAADTADKKRESLIGIYESKMLAEECPGKHRVNLVGEFQYCPIGNILFDEHGRFFVDLWTAPTRFGHPWIIMGTAESEEAFWSDVNQDEDILRLGAIKPAEQRRGAYFLTEYELNPGEE